MTTGEDHRESAVAMGGRPDRWVSDRWCYLALGDGASMAGTAEVTEGVSTALLSVYSLNGPVRLLT
jgi:hypothetical protein